jgi:RNA polymerase sigma-70 factor (ECF subfamily)
LNPVRADSSADLPNRDESEMIASILAGHTELYHDLIRPYERSVYKMALSFMKNEADAEDVAQEAFLKALRKLAEFRGQAKFSTWLISITLNEARARLRRQNVLKMEPLDATQDEVGHVAPAILRDWREVPSEALERKEICEMLRNAVAGLAPIYREVLLLRDVEEFSINETASALAITPSAVKVRLHRARITLQKVLAPQLKSAHPRRRWFSWS